MPRNRLTKVSRRSLDSHLVLQVSRFELGSVFKSDVADRKAVVVLCSGADRSPRLFRSCRTDAGRLKGTISDVSARSEAEEERRRRRVLTRAGGLVR
jgi:hypothetical protein